MIAIAMSGGKPEPVLDFHQLLEMIERDYQLDIQDVMNLLNDAAENYTQHPELEPIFDTFSATKNNLIQQHEDGVWGDSWLMAKEELQDCWEAIEAEINALESNSRKGNTKADIARRLRTVVANLQEIL